MLPTLNLRDTTLESLALNVTFLKQGCDLRNHSDANKGANC